MFIKEIFDGKSPDEFDEETLSTINKFFVKQPEYFGDSETAFRPPEYARLPAGEDPEADRAGCQSV